MELFLSFDTPKTQDEDDDIEPLSKNEFLFVFDLKSVGYGEKEKGQTLISEDLSSVAPELGLEPRTL